MHGCDLVLGGGKRVTRLPAVVGYCLLKSGALPLFAGVLVSYETLLALPVIAATFLGGYLGDEVRFGLARRYGDGIQRR